jgi:hypothetical protein
MTSEELQRLKAEAEAARIAATKAAEDAAADPSHPTRQLEAKDAAMKAADAEAALMTAAASVRATAAFLAQTPSTDTTEEIDRSWFKITGLGAYLLFVVITTVYLLAGLMMAETDEDEVKKRIAENSCCAVLTGQSNQNANASTTAPSSVANSNTTIGNANANANINANANVNANANANTNANPGTAVNAANGAVRPANVNTANTSGPSPTPNPDAPQPNIGKDVYIDIPLFIRAAIISADSYLFLVVLFSGMLGGAIRAIHSMVRHLGLRNFSRHWIWFYVTLPFVGGGLSEFIYFVIRGGFYGGAFGKGLVLNLFSFAALAALTGLFTDQAMEKLKKVAVTLLADTPPKVENAREIEEKKNAEKTR